MTKKTKKTKMVECLTTWVSGDITQGDKAILLDQFFYKSEGWYKLQRADGSIFESPSKFWSI